MDLSTVGNVARPNNWLGKSTWRQDGDYNGGMRDVRFWSKAKTQSDIVREMNVDLTGSEPNLALNYKLANSNDGNVAINTSGLPLKNGTITGATLSRTQVLWGILQPIKTSRSHDPLRFSMWMEMTYKYQLLPRIRS